MEEPTLPEMEDYYYDTNPDDLTPPSHHHPVTVIVYHNGDQLNFFRLVDRDASSSLSFTVG
jgi:hypothetical protein